MKELKFRHEMKHYINHSDCIVLQSRLRHIMKHDSHADAQGNYLIRSLYFDTPEDKALLEKISGVGTREKFRIRFYNFNDSFIRLEKKMKVNNLCAKLSEPLTRQQCDDIIGGDIKWMKNTDKPLLNELYHKMLHQQLKPKTVVDYLREAYVFKAGNVRVTFDKSIKTGLYNTNMFDKDLSIIETLDSRIVVLEVKFDNFLPEVISDIIQLGERNKLSVSKYALCRMYV